MHLGYDVEQSKVIASYLDHREQVDQYAAEYDLELDHLRGTGRHAPRLAQVRKRSEMRQ
jgi:hypothetical protein